MLAGAGLSFRAAPLDTALATRTRPDFRRRIAAVHAGFDSDIQPFFPPLMTDAEGDARFGAVVERLARVFGHFARRLILEEGAAATLSALGYRDAEQDLLLPLCTPEGLARADALLRFDFLPTAAGLQVLELNAAAGIGGIGLIEGYDDAFAGSDYQRLLADHGWHARSAHPMTRVAQLLQRIGGPRPHVALAPLPRDLDYQQTTMCAQYLARTGARVSVTPLQALDLDHGSVRAGGADVDVVWAVHTFESEMVDPQLRAAAQALRRKASEGRTRVLVPVTSGIFGNKALLALMRGAHGRRWLDPADLAWVAALVPDTRIVTATTLPALLDAHHDWVLKPARGVSGQGMLFGHRVSAGAWRLGLQRVIDSGVTYVAQRRCVPLPWQGDAGALDLVLGGIGVDGAYAGHFVRALATGTDKPINVSFGGTMAPCYVLRQQTRHLED